MPRDASQNRLRRLWRERVDRSCVAPVKRPMEDESGTFISIKLPINLATDKATSFLTRLAALFHRKGHSDTVTKRIPLFFPEIVGFIVETYARNAITDHNWRDLNTWRYFRDRVYKGHSLFFARSHGMWPYRWCLVRLKRCTLSFKNIAFGFIQPRCDKSNHRTNDQPITMHGIPIES